MKCYSILENEGSALTISIMVSGTKNEKKNSLCALRFGVKYSADTLQKLNPEMDGNSQGLWSGSTWLFEHYGMFLC